MKVGQDLTDPKFAMGSDWFGFRLECQGSRVGSIAPGRARIARSARELRNRVVLCLPPYPGLEGRIRETAQCAAASDAKFFVVTVRPDRLSDEDEVTLGGYAALTHQLHGEFVRLEGRPVAAALARFINEQQATEVVLGHRRRGRGSRGARRVSSSGS